MISKQNESIKGGKVQNEDDYHDSVLKFDNIEESWVQVVTLKNIRQLAQIRLMITLFDG